MKTVTMDLSQLKAHFKELQWEVPELSPELAADPSRHNEKVRMIAAGVRKITEIIATALKLKEDQIAFVQSYEDELEQEIAEREVKADILRITEEVDNYLNHSEPFYKAAACRAYLLHVLGLVYPTIEKALGMAEDLEQREMIVKDNLSPIKIGYGRYRVSEALKLNQKATDEVVNTINDFVLRFEQLERDRRAEKLVEIEKEATISTEEFKEGKPGKCLFEVPPEPILNKDGSIRLNEMGKEQWRAGGRILVETKEVGRDKKIHIFPLSASGAIEKDFASFLKFEVELEHHTLEWEAPPGSGKSFLRYREWAVRNRGLDDEAANAYVKKMQALWFDIQRAFRSLENKAELDKIRKELKSKATITPEQFFGIGGDTTPRDGIAFLEFDGEFKQGKGKPVSNIFFLVERGEEAGENSLTILEAPGHIAQWFDSNMGRCLAIGERFNKLPVNLQSVFRAIQGKVDLVSTLAKE